MGLIRAAATAAGSVFADQWKEYFYCPALPADVLAVQGQKRNASRNNNGSSNIISNGSIIAVADGQCMIIVEQGKVVDLCAEPGEYTYNMSTEPSLFSGKLSSSIPAVFQNIGKRFTFGGETAKDQRVYYFNTKELIGNKYGTPNPVPFRVVDERAGIDMDISIRCFGEYSYRIANPILFYTNVCGNVEEEYTRDQLDGQLKTELLTALQPAFAKLSEMGIRYSALPGHTDDMVSALNTVLNPKWSNLRGVEIVSVGISSVKASEEDEATIKQMQKDAAYMNTSYRNAAMSGAAMDAMRNAANNGAGAAMGFMNFNMAQNAAAANLYAADASANKPAAPAPADNAQQQPAAAAAPAAESWTCSCGTVNTGKFCSECGKPKPVPTTWTCSCGTVNTGKFCSECGKKYDA